MSRIDIADYIAGDSRRFDFTLVKEDDTPLDLSGAVVRWGIGTLGLARTVLLTKAISDGIVVTDASGGLLSVSIDADEFKQAGTFWHELEVVLASGESYTMARGAFTSAVALFVAADP